MSSIYGKTNSRKNIKRKRVRLKSPDQEGQGAFTKKTAIYVCYFLCTLLITRQNFPLYKMRTYVP